MPFRGPRLLDFAAMPRAGTKSALLGVIVAAALAGCGGGGGSTTAGQPGAGASPGRAVDWPYFGRVPERTRFLTEAPDPPFSFGWVFFAHQLIEFPPALAGDEMFVVNKAGGVYAVRTSDGKVGWKRDLGPVVTGPAYAGGLLYVAQLGGGMVALDASTGKQRWAFHPPGQLESSPLPVGGKVYLGSDAGTMWALDAGSGKVAWKRDLGAPIKASPSYHAGVVYVGDYHGGIHALSAADGHPRWARATGSSGFYSSPAIAFGRVYEARADGVLFALTLDGHPAWRFTASNDIYSSPAVGDVPGTGPTVFIGSYNHQLYALDAADGRKRWSYDVGGQIPGSPTVVGTTVYTSSFQTQTTVGLDAGNGKPVWKWGSAGYEPMVTDGGRVFLIGFQTVWAFDECTPPSEASGSGGQSGGPGAIPVCHRSADLHLVDVSRALRLDRPVSSAAR
jgi:outer membrane protein assembly factor BamB